ncbi:MAG: hydroxyisourate hydrolase [Motiliproteus sp.]
MAGNLTTHVLDTAQGRPGGGILVELYRIEPERRLLVRRHTNAEGRCDQPLLAGAEFVTGVYELVFSVGDYYRSQGLALPQPAFLDQVVLRFGIADASEHYHVPLLIAPYSYSTYRGR